VGRAQAGLPRAAVPALTVMSLNVT
jgi:hypothetical protein